MQRNEFETMVKELLPAVTEQAMENGRSMHRSWSRTAQKRKVTFMMPPM